MHASSNPDASVCLLVQENEYAIDVVLSDESQYTMFRNLKEIVNFHVSSWLATNGTNLLFI